MTVPAPKVARRPSLCSACIRAPSATNSTSRTRHSSMTRAPSCAGPPQQYFVKLGAQHLVGQGLGFVPGIRELEFLPAAVPWRDEFRAPFLHADGAHLVGNPKALEQRQVRRQQRLADMKTRVTGLFQQDHAVAILCQQAGCGGPGRTAADHQHVAAGLAAGRGCLRFGPGCLRYGLGHIHPPRLLIELG
jgi:hypothetical protein